ncbi:biopolymer transporter ExbD [Hoylesella buccalis]|jgi:biopolymer transport protein ExbD|uniref:ExbD/TolR family protein n=1 Tax=Hoylesella buccalis TaxID=28127 RepID=UPI001D087D5A|nr:biopolymer transporter ExbD [Hoylesella buccalis]MCB6902063.1 biopolymer transporter ExbD [Hoylesella buccalis]UEA62797.1 biopolymer transporter ExbD [Hoylesella buccalis]UWP49917.1 biopolymer transporter ExbD [Hoylesella buccalis ATCC 35310]
MLIRKRRHDIPGLNTTSTADISFMLLIFFLVTTSMDVDKGLRRQLPPAQQEKIEQESLVDKGKLMELKITEGNVLLLNEQPINMDELRIRTEEFITRVGKEHLISISASPESAYETYFNLQNELMAAYKNVRNRLARQRYGQAIEACNEAQRNGILEQCPQRIAETYQTNEEGAKP